MQLFLYWAMGLVVFSFAIAFLCKVFVVIVKHEEGKR